MERSDLRHRAHRLLRRAAVVAARPPCGRCRPGHGFARSLSIFIASRIVARGETPFLHAWADNAAAIRLYETLGFTLRREMATMAIRVA